MQGDQGGLADVDSLEDYVRRYDVGIDDPTRLRKILYDHVIDTIDNRIETQAGKVPNEHLHQYASNLFQNADLGEATHPSQAIQSEKCVLEVRVHRAESLAPKDVSGTSDPYCILGLAPQDLFTNLRSKKHTTKYVTAVKMKTLNPEWNECLEIPVTRSEITDHFFHVQVWDHDDEENLASAIGALKDVKGLRSAGRFMKEVAQSVGKKDGADDFMGFSAIPLRNIPLEGLEKWYSVRAQAALENVSGRIKIGLKLTCPHKLMAESNHPGKSSLIINGGRIENQLSNEAIYGGILKLIVNGRHQIYKDLLSEDEGAQVDGWDGKLQNVDNVLLQEFVTQRKVSLMVCAIAKWEIYCHEHIQLPDGLQMQCITSLLKDMENQNDTREGHAFRPIHRLVPGGEKAKIFTFERLPDSFDNFLRHCHRKIEEHQKIFPIRENNSIVRLGELLICLKTLREMKLYLTAKLVNTSMFGSGDVSKDVSESLRNSITKTYESLCVEYQVMSAKVADLEGDPIEEYNVSGLVKLVDTLHTNLVHGKGYFHPVFKKVMKIDYMAVMLGAIGSRLAGDLKEILFKVNKALSSDPDPVGEESSDKSTAMFQLYLSLRDLAEFTDNLIGVGTTADKFKELSLEQMTNDEEEVQNITSLLKGYHEFFRPTILRWLQMSRGRTVQRLKAAVSLDKVERIDDIAKHSSSSVDAISCLNSVVTFWLQIKWPDLMDGFLIATRIIEDISNGVELYANLVHDKLIAVGFFDDEGQFDVTEELCFALNNLEKVKLFLLDVLRDMKIELLAEKIDQMEQGPTGAKMMESFKVLVRNANEGMRRKIIEVTSVVGKKMQSDIQRYVESFATEVLKIKPKEQSGFPLNGHDSDYDLNSKQWTGIGEAAIGPLMNYLTTNIITLKEWLCDSNFRILLDILWKVCLQSMRDVFLAKHKCERPYFFSLCKYVLKDHLTVFFHADGEGLALNKMFSIEEYKALEMELKMRSASSEDLMRLFFSQMYDQQESLFEKRYGSLNVYAWYDKYSSEVKVDVISAENLVARDMNGLSDPFVQIAVRPKQMFPKLHEVQTLEKKKTLNPLFDGESFSFKIDRESVMKEGVALVFTVLDYDVIGSNDLEGECFLPLNILDGVEIDGPRGKVDRTFKLTLSQPGLTQKCVNEETADGPRSAEASSDSRPPSTTTLELLRQRIAFDRDASEFCRWRKKLEDATEDDDSSRPQFIKSILR